MLFLIAWRNIKRNWRRSLVTLILGILCFGLMIFYEAFNEGARGKMIDDAVAMYSGYVQIHGKGYQDNPNYDNLIYDASGVKEKIKDVPGIAVLAERFETFALYSTKEDSIGGMLTGVEPSKEAQVSRITRGLKEGRFLKDSDINGVYIGVDLAKRLGVGLGDEVVLISSSIDYSMAAAKLNVVGIFQTNFHDFDARAAFVNKKLMTQEFLAENIASQIIVKPKNKDQSAKLAKDIGKRLDDEVYEVVTWKKTMKDMVQFMQLDYAMDHISFALLLIIVFFVIMIFSLISIYQRKKELGIMRAIGTTQKQIYKILFVEISILTFISLIIGGIIGVLIALHFQANPLELKLDQDLLDMYRQYGIYDLVFPAKLNLKSFLLGTVPILFLMIFAVFYPAWSVNKLKPIEAIEER